MEKRAGTGGLFPGIRARANPASVRIPDASYQALKLLAVGRSMTDVLAEVIEDLRRKRLLEATNTAFEALRADPVARSDEQRERDAWDATLADGLEGD